MLGFSARPQKSNAYKSGVSEMEYIYNAIAYVGVGWGVIFILWFAGDMFDVTGCSRGPIDSIKLGLSIFGALAVVGIGIPFFLWCLSQVVGAL